MFDGMGIMAILLVLIVGYAIGRLWDTPARLIGM
jgi:hypothetical protein